MSGEKTKLLPKLRFPEFRDTAKWEIKHLGRACHMQAGKFVTAAEIREQSAQGLFPCYGGNGLRGYTSTFTHSGKYALIGRQGALCGNIRQGIGQFHATEHAIVVTPKNGVTGDWLFFVLDLMNLNRFATGQAQPGLSVDVLEKLPVAVPSEEIEQQKIADCLSSLDELIAAQARKVDALKTHKKGLMQQLFPREGETQPRLRFPEFRDAGEWVPKRLSGVIDLISGMHLSPDAYSTAGEVPYFTGPSDFTNDLQNVTKWTKRSANISLAEDTLITVKGSGVGEIWYSMLPEAAMGRQLMAIRTKRGSSRFIFQFLLTKRTRFEDLGSGNLIPGLSRAVILELDAQFPSPPEQQRIADCLTSLDNLITAATRELDTLKTHKKGLMQQLFPSVEAVEA